LRARAEEALAQIGLQGIEPATPAGRLSPAQRQMVEIARAVASRCRVLALDEPTSSLAAADTARLFELIRRLKARGIAVVYISHFIEEIQAIADRFTVLRDGETVGGGAAREATAERIVALMVGRDVRELYPRSPRAAGATVLTVRGLAGAGKPEEASFELRRGEVLGIAGLVGAGRTELIRAIFGLAPVRRGEVRVGLHSGSAAPWRRWAQGVGLVSEDRKNEGLAAGLSVADNLTLPRLAGLGPWRLVLPGRQRAACRRWVERLGIRCAGPEQPVAALSGGNQQKVAVARLLHADADVLLLDEPTRGIDVGSKAEIYRLIDELAARGKAVLMVSSYLPELLGVCDRIAVMCRGRLGAARPREAWDERELLRAAIGREAA